MLCEPTISGKLTQEMTNKRHLIGSQKRANQRLSMILGRNRMHSSRIPRDTLGRPTHPTLSAKQNGWCVHARARFLPRRVPVEDAAHAPRAIPVARFQPGCLFLFFLANRDFLNPALSLVRTTAESCFESNRRAFPLKILQAAKRTLGHYSTRRDLRDRALSQSTY